MFWQKKFIKLDKKYIQKIAKRSLAEDLSAGDPTTDNFVAKNVKAAAKIFAKENGVIAGVEITKEVFRILDKNIKFKVFKADGSAVKKGETVLEISGKARALLSGERVALNYLQHLSGVASAAADYVKELKGTKTKLLDTRKTIPGLRILEKYAVKAGGGENHRLDLSKMVMVKDNHLQLSLKRLALGIAQLRKKQPGLKIEVEVNDLALLDEIVKLDIDVVMLDNMTIAEMKKAVAKVKKAKAKLLIEASGNVSLKNIRKIALCGVDFISVGNITHSVKALDLSMLFK
jgi:nicotinate-nucleotide pyrophosphorylase (carboxylating)